MKKKQDDLNKLRPVHALVDATFSSGAPDFGWSADKMLLDAIHDKCITIAEICTDASKLMTSITFISKPRDID